MPDPQPPTDSQNEQPELSFNPSVFLETGQKLIDSGLAKAIYRPTQNGRQIIAAIIPFAEKQWLAFSTLDLQSIAFSLEDPTSLEQFVNDANELNTGPTSKTSLGDLIYLAQGMKTGFKVLADSKDQPDQIIEKLPNAITYAKNKLLQMKANREKAAKAIVNSLGSINFD